MSKVIGIALALQLVFCPLVHNSGFECGPDRGLLRLLHDIYADDSSILSVNEVTSKSSNVFKVIDGKGQAWAVRLPGKWDNLDREQRVSLFFSNVMGIKTSSPRIAEKLESKIIMSEIERLLPSNFSKYLRASRKDFGNDFFPKKVAVASYVEDAPTGYELLGQEGLGSSFLYSLRNGEVGKIPKKRRRELREEWNSMTLDQEKKIVTQAKEIWPELIDEKSSEVVFFFLLKKWSQNPDKIDHLFLKLAHRLDPKVKAQVNEFWLSCLMMKIPDCHAGNWIVKDGKLIAIDLAYPFGGRSSDIQGERFLEGLQNPYGIGLATPQIIDDIIKNTPEIFFLKLKKLNLEKLRKTEEHPFTEKEWLHLERMINYLLKKRTELIQNANAA